MSEVVTSTVQLAGVFFIALALSSCLCSVLYALFRRLVGRFGPATRSLATLCLAVAAPAIGLITVALNLHPGLARLVVMQHCHGGDCATHAPMVAGDTWGSIGLMAVVLFLAPACAVGVVRVLLLGRQRLSMLFALGAPGHASQYLIVDSDRPFAWCCGLLRQRIVIARALLDRLSPTQLEAVLAHERAHADRFDNLRNLAAAWATRLWPGRFRSRLLADLAADGEQACDVAARRGGATSRRTDRSPLLAYLLVAGAWSLQFALVAAATHPIVEAIASVSL